MRGIIKVLFVFGDGMLSRVYFGDKVDIYIYISESDIYLSAEQICILGLRRHGRLGKKREEGKTRNRFIFLGSDYFYMLFVGKCYWKLCG